MNSISVVEDLKNKVLAKKNITKEEAMLLVDSDLNELSKNANEIREHFCKNKFDICTIINAKSGKCSENCKCCAQSSFYKTKINEYPLLYIEAIINEAKSNACKGVTRFSIVTSGKKPTQNDLEKICEAVSKIRKNKINVCASLGLLNLDELKMLKDAGLS